MPAARPPRNGHTTASVTACNHRCMCENFLTLVSNLWRSQYHATISAAEETLEERLKEKEVELEKMKQTAEQYRTESEQWDLKARALKQTISSLKTALGNILEGTSTRWDRSSRMPRQVEGLPLVALQHLQEEVATADRMDCQVICQEQRSSSS